MDKSKKLIFFNKEGYPYNFQYNEEDRKWEGTLIFDENSNTLFKTQGLYVFEQVDPIDVTLVSDFEPSQLFNYSGMTFIPKTYENQQITNIEKVNSNQRFHTKWIYGEDFDIKFKPGTIITIKDETGTHTGSQWSDFVNNTLTYFPVLSVKKNAILISTYTNNSLYSNVTFESGLTVSSHNIIRIPDYGDETLVDINNLNYYEGKKMSIVNSYNNDGIRTFIDYSILKDKVYDFDLSTETTGTLNIDITLFTERPRLYSGPVTINITNTTSTGTEIIFHNDINNDINFFDTGQTIIFEDYVGDDIFPYNPTFTITGYKDKELLLSTGMTFVDEDDRYFIYIDDIQTLSGLSFVDQIKLEAVTFESGVTIHHDRLFDVMNVYYPDEDSDKVRIEVEQYVSSEYGNTYNLYKKYKRSQIQTLYAQQGVYSTPQSYDAGANCFSTTNHIRISQEILDEGDRDYYYENTIDALNLVYGNFLNSHGVDVLHHYYSGQSYLLVEGLQEYNYEPYFEVTADIDGVSLDIGNNFTFTTGFTNSDVYYFETEEQLVSETIRINEPNKLNRSFNAEIKLELNNDLIDYGFKIILNSVEYFINFTGDTYTTINAFIDKYEEVFKRQGFSISTRVVESDISDILPSFGSSSGDTNYDSDYDLDNDGDVDIQDATLLGNERAIHSLIISGDYPNVEVIDFDVFVNIYSSYELIEVTQNKGVVIASDILKAVDVNLFDLGLSTGMVVSLNDSTNSLNNKEYNILDITEHEILLSYQGPFLSDYCEDGRTLNMHVKEFIRKPRSYYNKTVDYKFSWVEPLYGEIDPDIFFYDYSGEQLVPYNGMSGLTYTGIKPLYDETKGNKVFLNKEPNKYESETSNPAAQQTIFNEITHRLEMLNDSDSYSFIPEPLELFLGFYSEKEGVSVNTFKMEKIEYAYYSGVTQERTDTEDEKHFIISGDTITYITNNPLFDFNNYDFEKDQNISIDLVDNSETGQTIFNSYGIFRVDNVTHNKITIDSDYSGYFNYFNTKELYEDSGKTFTFVIKTEPKELLRCKVYGQSEIEDERLDINLRNLGINVFKEAEFIFKESDIGEHSVDYIRLNRKRKEMLSIYNQIFDYVGSYKALIHSIDFFGYNDLKLYEYYRNVKPDSPLYGKLFKILIPDIFDNSVLGWTDDNFIRDNYDKGYYKKTNLFNLTYRITDELGNYSLQYSLDDVQTKLMALVKWLRKNVVPLSSNIRDITGVADSIHQLELKHDSSTWVTKYVTDDVVVGVNYYYTSTRINKNNYLFTINFYILDGYDKPESYTVKIKTFSINSETFELIPQSNKILYKVDYEPYSMNLNLDIDQYVLVEVDTYNGYGVGYSNSKMFKYDIGKNFILVNSNFDTNSFNYVSTEDGFYIVEDGRYYIVKE